MGRWCHSDEARLTAARADADERQMLRGIGPHTGGEGQWGRDTIFTRSKAKAGATLIHLPEDHVPSVARPKIASGRCEVRQGVGAARQEQVIKERGREELVVAHFGCLRSAWAECPRSDGAADAGR